MWIKVCGIRDRQTAQQIAEVDIDAIGLNFYSKSPRFVTTDEAQEISQVLPRHIARVGLFVNHTIDEIEAVAGVCSLDYVQLHGDETVAYLAEVQQRLPQARLIRAWRMKQDGLRDLAQFLEECRDDSVSLAGCLVDAHVAGVFGGSGHTVDWSRLKQEYEFETWPPMILAGGLNPANVAQAIGVTDPWGVDVASGVESTPGVKDLSLVRRFVTNARQT